LLVGDRNHSINYFANVLIASVLNRINGPGRYVAQIKQARRGLW